MCQSLPVDILAQLTALGTALVQQAQQQRGDLLTALEAGGRTVHRRCPRCDRLVGMQEQRGRTLRTTCVALTFRCVFSAS